MISLQNNRILGGALMIAGTAIGAGMLGLPIKNGPTGFPLAMASLFSMYLFMLGSIFLYFENVLYMEDQSANLISMTKERLSKPLQIFTWFSYAIIHYTAIWAYFSGSGDIISSVLAEQLNLHIREETASSCSQLCSISYFCTHPHHRSNQPFFYDWVIHNLLSFVRGHHTEFKSKQPSTYIF